MTTPGPLRGRKIGDRRVRIERPHAAYFRWSGKGIITAKEAASQPKTGLGRAFPVPTIGSAQRRVGARRALERSRRLELDEFSRHWPRRTTFQTPDHRH